MIIIILIIGSSPQVQVGVAIATSLSTSEWQSLSGHNWAWLLQSPKKWLWRPWTFMTCWCLGCRQDWKENGTWEESRILMDLGISAWRFHVSQCVTMWKFGGSVSFCSDSTNASASVFCGTITQDHWVEGELVHIWFLFIPTTDQESKKCMSESVPMMPGALDSHMHTYLCTWQSQSLQNFWSLVEYRALADWAEMTSEVDGNGGCRSCIAHFLATSTNFTDYASTQSISSLGQILGPVIYDLDRHR
jgi:hypothetical protein